MSLGVKGQQIFTQSMGVGIAVTGQQGTPQSQTAGPGEPRLGQSVCVAGRPAGVRQGDSDSLPGQATVRWHAECVGHRAESRAPHN